MPTIDCQVHAYERDRPERPWAGTLAGPAEVTGDQMVVAMDAVGVDGAILVSPFSMYRYDASYALEVYARHPGRFRLVKPFDPGDPAVADEIAAWADTPGAVGARLMLSRRYAGDELNAEHPGVNRIVEAAGKTNLPLNVLCWGQLNLVAELARRHPDTQIVIDHLGLPQPFVPPPPDEPFADLPTVLRLAEFEHVAIKISGACTLSHEPFPFHDIWDPLGPIFEAFGFQRCMWGTDWTRAVNLLTYEQGVEAFRVTDRLSADERAALMGGSLSRIYGWAPA
ncbi:MAG: amidohydrolase family protein [Dehalococcoidia bacterium]